MTSSDIRKAFIEFFVQKHKHTFVPSSPVVPHDDPTLLFTNAGMNQFKPIFLGQEKRAYTRAVNTQKCIRAGGKHNDLDDVGRSRRHHTFFEMLGNWSFGDYFKQGAIEMSWELLTKVWKLDPTRLHVSCFEGDEKNGVPRDTEAANIWRKVANWEQFGRKSDEHIHYFGKDNFWEMGDTGPCGPCTEIYYDRTPDKTGGPYVNGEDPRVMEIWNNVFIQYNRNADRSLTTLPSQHVDTGMGFERICQVLQDKGSNYDIDLFDPFWAALTKLSGKKYTGKFPATNAADPVAEAADAQLRYDIAFRVIADHIRCLTFALTDGAVPSNEGRGYVLRRILRRAVRFGRQQLELKEPFLHTLVPVVVNAMGDAFPELKKNPQHVVDLVKDEEISFSRTLDRGIELFEEAAMAAVANEIPNVVSSIGPTRAGFADDAMDPVPGLWRIQVTVRDGSGATSEVVIQASANGQRAVLEKYGKRSARISGSAAFKLHDTYGFPIDLTRIMAEERGMSVDVAGYEKLMEEARDKARAGGKGEASTISTLTPDAISALSSAGAHTTDDSAKFAGQSINSTVLAIWDGSDLGLSPSDAYDDQELAVILDHTNFYAEMGGQVGDRGTLIYPGMSFDVQTTRVVGKYVLHVGRVTEGTIRVGDKVTAVVSGDRSLTQQNHTSTHLANWALREVFGDSIQQKGSLVDPEKLRFDFSHGKSIADDELGKIESLVGQSIEKKLPVYAKEAPQEQALKINGLRAVFGEKYPPLVRVVSVGAPVDDLLKDPTNEKWRAYSIEFCGGTHISNASEAGAFVVTGEESVSKGIRRIVALTGDAAKSAIALGKQLDDTVAKAKAVDGSKLSTELGVIQKLIASPGLPLRVKRRAQQAVSELQTKLKAFEKSQKSSESASIDIGAVSTELLNSAADLGGGKLIVASIPGATDDTLRGAIDSIKKRAASVGVLLATVADGKVSFIAVVSDDLIAKGLKAGDWVREAAKTAGGGGGGRPNLAMAGGKDPTKLDEALDVARAFAKSVVKES